MITKEQNTQKSCLLCASEYHLEMILLPFIKTRIEDSKFIIFTETSLEQSIEKLLDKVNLSDEIKTKIKGINWTNENNFKLLKKYIENDENVNIIINGKVEYINKINEIIKNDVSDKVNIIDCFHIDDTNINVEHITSKYKNILNTQKM